MTLESISDGLNAGIGELKQLASSTTGVVIGSALGGAALAGAGAIIASKIKKARSKTRRKSSSKRKSSRRKAKRKSYRYARTARKAKDRSTKRIRMTKSGQPYIILASGKARFISKKSARSSRRRKGGRY